MLGTIGDKWLERLHQHVAKDLRTKGWSQNEIADLLGSTQSTISRQMQKTIRKLGATADEATIDSWGNELSHKHWPQWDRALKSFDNGLLLNSNSLVTIR